MASRCSGGDDQTAATLLMAGSGFRGECAGSVAATASRHKGSQARFFGKLLKQQGCVPGVIVTDQLKSDEAAKKQVMKNVEQRQHEGLNNRAENSPQPTRGRERRMRRFKPLGQAQRCL